MKPSKIFAPVVFGALTLAGAQAQAAGTAAGITIKNTATLDYKVNAVDQTSVKAIDNLLVDAKVDLTLERTDNNPSSTASSDLITIAGSQYYTVGAFKLKNTGNSDTFFTLGAVNTDNDHAVLNLTDTSTDNNANTKNNSASDFVIFVETDGTPGLSTSDTLLAAAAELELAKESAEKVVYVAALAANIQGVDNDLFGTDLTATVSAINYLRADGATKDKVTVTGHNKSATADGRTFNFVYADADNNAAESASDVLRAAFPDLGNGDGDDGTDNSGNFTKTSVVIEDPINGTDTPKAIPGAIVEYTITVKNSGSVNAEDVVITDTIPTSTTYVANSVAAFEADGSTALTGATANYVAADKEIVVNLGTLDGGATAADQETNVIKFRVTVD